RAIEVTSFEGRPLASRRLIVFGPAALSPAYRGRHLIRQLYESLRRHAAGRWDTGIVFVAHANPHSMGSSQALGMTRIADFEDQGRGYALLVFPIPPVESGGRPCRAGGSGSTSAERSPTSCSTTWPRGRCSWARS